MRVISGREVAALRMRDRIAQSNSGLRKLAIGFTGLAIRVGAVGGAMKVALDLGLVEAEPES